MEMLCIMSESQPRGYLLVADNAPTDAQLAVLVGAPTDHLADLIAELERAGVFSRTRKGAIYSRRMTDDEKRASKARSVGKSGGNPALLTSGKQTAISPQDNPQDKGRDKPTVKPHDARDPDTRSQKEKNLTTTPVPDDSARDRATGGGGQDRSGEETRAQALADRVQDILGVDVQTDQRWWNATQAVARMLLAGATEAEVIAAANEAKRSTAGKKSPGPGYVEKIAARLVAERPTAPTAPADGGHPSGPLLTEERPYLRLWKASKAHRADITARANAGDDDALDRWATSELEQLRTREIAS
jgi:hypothetical protein